MFDMTVTIKEMEILLDCKKYVERRAWFYERVLETLEEGTEEYAVAKKQLAECESVLHR